jgi:hypothetical protein
MRAMGRIEHSLMVRDIPLTDLRPPPATTSYHKKVTSIAFRCRQVEDVEVAGGGVLPIA